MIIESLVNYYEGLKQKLSGLRETLNTIISRMSDLELLINGCTDANKNIDLFISDTLETAGQKFRKSSTPNFEAYYMRNLGSILNGESISMAVASISAIKSNANIQYLSDEDASAAISADIKNTEDEMNSVSLQMQNEEQEVK